MLGIGEILIIIMVIAVVFFGVKEIPQLARTLGRAKGEFKKGKREIEKELKNAENEVLEEKEPSNFEKKDETE
ncbi:MAG: twin-arginine translocase TatA/TatE family subunit [bacterium]|nr:twin-arginine translocase TatA/TatE family subunit [bacterium]